MNENIENTVNTINQNLTNHPQEVTSNLLINILKERKSEHRWRLMNKFFWLFLILVIIVITSMNSGNVDNIEKSSPHIAVLQLNGIIAMGGDTDAQIMVEILEEAFSNENAIAVFIDANSPGGSPVQSAIINDAIERFKKQYKKPVITVVSDVCASGCYYIVSGSDKIIANTSSIIGSIGVILNSIDVRGLMDKIGVKQRSLLAGEDKAMLSPFEELKPSHKQRLQKMIDLTHNEFIRVVKEGRGDRLNSSKKDLFSGLVWTGSESISLGLIDEIGDIYTAAQDYDYPSQKLVVYKKDIDWVQKFAQIINSLPFLQTGTTLQAKF